MHCLQTLLYLSALTAVQRNVCHAKGVFVQQDLQPSLQKTLQLHLNACLFDITKKKKKLRTPNCDHTTTTITTTSTTTIQILQGLFCICECRLSATFVRHGIVSISLYFNHGKKQNTSFIFKTNRGVLFQLTQRALTKARQLETSLHFS